MITDEWRRFYAEEVRIAANVHSPALIEAFARVPREKFMGPAPWQVASPEMVSMPFMGLKGGGYLTTEDPRDLYHNVLVALDAGKHLNNGQPSALARWIDALELKPGDSVYHLAVGLVTIRPSLRKSSVAAAGWQRVKWSQLWRAGLARISPHIQVLPSTPVTERRSTQAPVTRCSSMPGSRTRTHFG